MKTKIGENFLFKISNLSTGVTFSIEKFSFNAITNGLFYKKNF
jgi:hypothetical protein